jgi:hypothetical protein
MAKEKPVIHKAPRLRGVKYIAGMEEELAENATADEIQHYTNRGSISGFGAEVEKDMATRQQREKAKAKTRDATRTAAAKSAAKKSTADAKK